VRDQLRARVTEWHALIGRQPVVARQSRRKLMVAS
jgi:hypothetical protein